MKLPSDPPAAKCLVQTEVPWSSLLAFPSRLGHTGLTPSPGLELIKGQGLFNPNYCIYTWEAEAQKGKGLAQSGIGG